MAAVMVERAVRRCLSPMLGGALIFVALVALLGWQMRTGRDPLLGRAVHAVSSRTVLVRVVHRRVIITTVIADSGAASTPGPGTNSASTTSSPPAVSYAPSPSAASPLPLTTGASGH